MKSRYVKVMPDWCADPLWSKGGGMMSVEHFPISDFLRQRLLRWARWHDARHSDSEITNFEQFVVEGHDLAESIKLELPDWTVVYFDIGRLAKLWDAKNEKYIEHQLGRAYYEIEIELE